MHNPELVIRLDDNHREQLTKLSASLQLPLVESSDDENLPPYFLAMHDGALCLQEQGEKTGPVMVDFLGGASTYRRTKGGGELIVKAMGGSKQHRPTVLDVTAGLGRDSFVLASWGFPVHMLERSPVVAALLRDGLHRALVSGHFDISDIVARMQLWQGESLTYLQSIDITQEQSPDIIYMDPMFPPSKKSALVKKEMRAFHYIVGD